MNVSPREQTLLGAYEGRKPEAPAWFDWALSQPVTRSFFDHDGVSIELLTWGEAGKPGLLFLHGDSAHADWWSFIAPFFAAGWRCAAISWSGMGRSGWRKGGYSFHDYVGEITAAIGAAELDKGSGVTLIAHSLGGYPALMAGAVSARINGIITVDSAILPAHLQLHTPRPTAHPHRLYQSQAEALTRFRFLPASTTDALYVVDHIARLGLTEIAGPDGKGWRWCFDPAIWSEPNRADLPSLPKAARCPLLVIIGEQSQLITPEAVAYMRDIYPPDTPFVSIPAAGHHVMVDQPLALVAALRASLALWPQPKG